jgi:hypothetical protein
MPFHTIVRSSLRFALATGLALSTSTPAFAQTAAPTLDNPNPAAVTGLSAARRFFHLAATRRVDLCLIGDSNARSQGITGHEDGMARAFAARFGMYATRVNPVMGNGGYGAEVGGEASQCNYPFSNDLTTHPPEVRAFEFPFWAMPQGVAGLTADKATPDLYNWGYWIYQDHPLGINGPLRYHLSEFVTDPGTGSYAVEVREAAPGSAFNTYAMMPVPASLRFEPGIVDREMDIPAGPKSPHGVMIAMSSIVEHIPAQGPLTLMYHRVERTDHPTGIAYSPLWEAGGRSARHVMEDFRNQADLRKPFREYLRQLTRLQNADPVLLVHVMHGGNDILDPTPSLGPVGGIPSNTPAGFRDNLDGIIATLRAAWADAGYDPANLFFLFGPYHPRGVQEDVQAAYANVWRDLANSDPQMFTVDGLKLTTAQELLDRGYLYAGTDTFHLALPGFRAFGKATVSSIDRALCPADFDENGAADILDVFAFLTAWFNADRHADANFNGSVDLLDVFAFLSTWFQGCPPL